MSKNEKSCCVKKTSIGGQALMEGIMMRGPKISAMAVRNTDGEIVLEKFPTETKKRAKFFKLPIVRGLFNYIDSMMIGTKCLMRSAEISGLEEAEEEIKKEKKAKKEAKSAKKAQKRGVTTEEAPLNDEKTSERVDESKEQENKGEKQQSIMMGTVMTVSVILGIVLSVGLFFILPMLIYEGLAFLMPFLKSNGQAVNSLIKSSIEGVLKLFILIGYMALVSLMKDIRRTFQFHGAEHKTIFCYESGLELTVENVRQQGRFHPRCGTSFLILMIIVSIFISFLIDPLFLLIFGFVPNVLIRVCIKLLLIPLIVGIGYELIKLAGRYNNWFTRIISAPGVLLQHVTVLEPDDSMIECAIAAMNEVIPEDESDKW